MNIVLTNDDGYTAPGIAAAFEALRGLGSVHVVAPMTERSACSHMITLRRPITVDRRSDEHLGRVYAVEGTPADCIRLASAELISEPIDLIVSGINRGANSGVDVFYSGTIAAAREGAILGIPSIAVSQAIRVGTDVDWSAAANAAGLLIRDLLAEELPGPGFWSVNLPLPIPPDVRDQVRRVPVATDPTPMTFDRITADNGDDGRVTQYSYGASYWLRNVAEPTDYSTVRDGQIAVSAIPLCGRF